MIETAAYQLQKLKDIPRESGFKESETKANETPLQSSMQSIETRSLESLHAENREGSKANADETRADYLKENKVSQIEQNRENGREREDLAKDELMRQYPEDGGAKLHQEAYLRDKSGEIVRDPVTNEATRIDFTVSRDGKIVKSVEVTSETAPKESQMAKESRVRDAGGRFIKDRDSGQLIEFPKTVETEIWRYA